MSLNTRYPGEIVIANTPSNLIFGTVMLGDTYGQVVSAGVTREADVEELMRPGGLLGVILRNPKFKLKLKTLFAADTVPPSLAELVTFPLAGIQGRVMPPIQIDWEEKGHRMLSIEVTSWDGFSATNMGGGSAATYVDDSYTAIVDSGVVAIVPA